MALFILWRAPGRPDVVLPEGATAVGGYARHIAVWAENQAAAESQVESWRRFQAELKLAWPARTD